MLRVASLSTFYPLSYVSIARPWQYNDASHTAQPEASVDRDPRDRGGQQRKVPPYLEGVKEGTRSQNH